MNVLVTGGAGFIGSHIVDMLIKEGNKVSIIDSLVHGRLENINGEVNFYNMDIRDSNVSNVFEIERPDMIIHEAAQISVEKSIKNPIYDADVNIIGTLNILENIAKFKTQKIIYPSSAAIYGEPKYLPIREDHPHNMESGYGISKNTIEQYLEVYKKLYGIDYTILCYSNVYGPRQDSLGEGGVVSIFCKRLLSNKVPYIFGDGGQTRDFVYVKDVARANIMAMKDKGSNFYNVCSNTETSINELLDIMSKIEGEKILPVHLPKRGGDIRCSVMTYEKINKEVGWQPSYSLIDGLKQTFEYYRKI
mgnify:CR=1 FL=1